MVSFCWNEWRVLKTASFYIAVAITGVGVFWLAERHYGATIAEKEATVTAKDATITTLTVQLSGADRENEKLTKRVENLSIYHGKDAPPLKANALILAGQIHKFIKDWKGTEQEEPQFISKYMLRFGERAVVVRNDLDQNNEQSDLLDQTMDDWSYHGKSGVGPAKIIADEIEKLANHLPDAP
ncbi:MAG TPA: hypothetical protein VGR14_00305 [Verrucomicrobiae bacterium]|nr:hypothetical protein [Verrucomicrobiae bacterium]